MMVRDAKMTEKRERLLQGLRVSLMLGDDDPEQRALLDKIAALSHVVREGHLFVGSGIAQGKKGHELRTSRNGTVYCKCPNFAFEQRPGKAGSFCKHLVYALALGLEIPKTEDLPRA